MTGYRKFIIPLAVTALAMALARPCAGEESPAAIRVPALAGPSIRLDFSRPFIEEWLGRDAAPVRAQVPRVPGADWAASAGQAAWEKAKILEPLSRGAPRTEFRVFSSESALFFLARCSYRETVPGGEAAAREALPVETVEIRLREPIDKTGRFRLRDRPENPLYLFTVGTRVEPFASRDGERIAPYWESSVESSVEGWTARVMIPFAALGIGMPRPEIEVNIGRDAPGSPVVSWGPVFLETAHRRLVLEGVKASAAREAAGAEPGVSGPLPGTVETGSGVALKWLSGVAREQDRWVEGSVRLGEAFRPGDELEVSLWAPGAAAPLELVRVAPGRPVGRLLVDPRRWGLSGGRVSARLVRGEETLGVAEGLFEARPLPGAYPDGFRVPLVVNAADGPAVPGAWPLTAGVPFPAGALWDASGWVVEDGAGARYPTQLEATGRWALEGSVKWLRVDTVAPADRELYLVYRPGAAAPAPADPVRVARDGQSLTMAVGEMTYEITAGLSPVREIRSGSRVLATAEGARGLYLVDQSGRLAIASAEGAEILIEASGPVAACVRIEGDYRTADGEAVARHITRLEMAAGQPFARVVHTLVLTRDTNEVWFREAGWELALSPGAEPEALFGVSRDDAAAFHRVASPGEAWLVQESYYRFGAGEKRFSLVSGGREVLAGQEMGDWFLLQGEGGGLMLSCRESARQHPKEFHVAGNLMNLKLFSPRAGEELDFRTDTLIDKWNLREWFLGHGISPWIQAGRGTDEERRDLVIEDVRKIRSDALGWAKTHEILFSPSPGRRGAAAAAACSWHHSRPVFTLADPWWIYRSRAMGPLYPRDPERFPEAERLIEGTVSFFASHVPRLGLWGFVDYNAGPTFNYPAGRQYPQPRRWNYTYTLRPDSWRAFARSGSRETFDFATGSCRTWGDNSFASWGGGGKTKGLYRTTSAPDEWTGSMALPFYWGHATQTHYDHMSDKGQFTWDYHLTGWRRAADIVRDFAGGMKDAWTPGVKRSAWDVMPNFRLLMQCYEFTWDDDFRQLAYNAFKYAQDTESAIGHDKDRAAYRSSSYKKGVHFRDVLAAWEFFGDPRFLRNMRLLGDYLWEGRQFGSDPVQYTSPTGLLGNFLYGETGDPGIARELLIAVRRAASRLGDETGHGISMGSQEPTFVLEGIPAALDVISRSNADRNPVASWAAARDFGYPLDFYLFKEDPDTLLFSTRLTWARN